MHGGLGEPAELHRLIQRYRQRTRAYHLGRSFLHTVNARRNRFVIGREDRSHLNYSSRL